MSKITEGELQELKAQETKKGAILHDLGLLEIQKHALAHMYTNLLNEQIDSNNAIKALYGKIDINLEDGSYKLISEDEKDK